MGPHIRNKKGLDPHCGETHVGMWCEGTWYLIRFSTWRWKSTNLCTLTPLLPTSVGSCWVTHAKVEVTNPFGSIGHWTERGRGSDGPDHKGLSHRVGGTLDLGCNPPRRRILQNQTKGRWRTGSCGESKLYKGVNPDQKFWPFRLKVLRGANTSQLSKNIRLRISWRSHGRKG